MYRLFFLVLPIFLFSHSVYSEELNQTQMLQTFNALPLSFTENKGQADSDVQFISQGNGSAMFFSPYETTFVLLKNKVQTVEKNAVTSESAPEESEYFLLRRRFLNTNINLTAEGEERQQWNTSYFIGNDPSQWCTGVPNYEKIRVTNLYEGIDLVYYGDKNVLKYDLVIQPKANPSKVRFYYEGAEGYNVNNDGDLEIYTPTETVIEKKPYSYQIIEGEKKEIDVDYKINDTTISFEVSSYDNKYPLIIDPELEYSTFLSGKELGDIYVYYNECLYVTCSTKSLDFPGISYGDHGRTDRPHFVILVVKFNSDFSGLIYSCLIGGNEQDYSNGIKVDSDGNAFIIGISQSFNFPVTDQAYKKEHSIDDLHNLVALKLNVSGDSLIYSTFIGPIYSNPPCSMDIDNEGNVYMFGKTLSEEFPVTEEAYDKNPNDIFVCKLNSIGTNLVYSTFFGGSDYEYPYGIAVDDSGNAYVTGDTYSSDFPVTDGSIGDIIPWADGFVSKFDPSGSNLVYSAVIDGSTPRAITIDFYGNAYVTGDAYSEFHTTPDAYKTTLSGSQDAFVLKLSPSGSELLYSTFIGGKTMGGSVSNNEMGLGIVLDNIGNSYITGFESTNDFPTTPDAYDSSYGGGDYDAFVCKLNPDGSELIYSTYLGGGKIDMGRCIAIDNYGSVFIAGTTESSDFPVTENAFDKEPKSMFVCKLNLDSVHYSKENNPHLFL